MAAHLSTRRKVFGVTMLTMALALPVAMGYTLGFDREELISLFRLVDIFLPPFLVFAFLGFRCLFFPSSRFAALVGAALGAFLSVAIPYGLAWYEISRHFPGGANIGLGLILLGEPLYLVFATMIGWQVGDAVPHRSRMSRRF